MSEENMFNDGLGGCVVCGTYFPEDEARDLWIDGEEAIKAEELFNQFPALHATSEEMKAFTAEQKIEYVKQAIEHEIICCEDDLSIHPMQIYWAITGNEWGYFDYLAEN